MKILIILTLLFTTPVVFAQTNELIPYYAKGKYGYSNEAGKIIIQPNYSFATFFKHGFARVGLNATELKSGSPNILFINNKGQNAFKDTFYSATDFFPLLIETKPGQYSRELVSQVVKAGKTMLISTSGTKITSKAYKFTEFEQSEEEKYVSFDYDYIYGDDNKRGLAIDNKIILEPIYDWISVISLRKRIFIVKKDDKSALINQNLKEEIKWIDEVGQVGSKDSLKNEYFFSFQVNGKSGLMNENKSILIEPVYDRVEQLDQDETKITFGNYINGRLIVGLYDILTKTQLLPIAYTSIEKTHLPNICKVKKHFDKSEIEFYVNTNGIQYFIKD